MADVADHQRADVDAHADAQRPAELAADLAVEPVDGDIDVAGGIERLPAAGASPSRAPKIAIRPSPRYLSIVPPCRRMASPTSANSG